MKLFKCLNLVFLIPLVLLGGCALTKDHICIDYHTLSEIQAIPEAENSHVKVDVQDNRLIKTKVSCKKNGYGMEMAGILSKKEVSAIINDAIGEELSARGFILEDGGDYNALINVDLLRFYSDFKVGFFASSAEADLQMNVLVNDRDGKDLYRKNISVTGKERTVFLHGGKNAKLALEDALRNGVAELMQDSDFIKALLHSR